MSAYRNRISRVWRPTSLWSASHPFAGAAVSRADASFGPENEPAPAGGHLRRGLAHYVERRNYLIERR